MAVTFPPHLTRALQPVEVAPASTLKGQSREALRMEQGPVHCSSTHADSEVSPTMTRRAVGVVAAAVDAVHGAAPRVWSTTACAIAGLVYPNEAFKADPPLAGRLRASERRRSGDSCEGKARTQAGLHQIQGLDVRRSHFRAGGEEAHEAASQGRPRRRAVVEIPPHEKDRLKDEAEDGRAFRGWTNAAVRAVPPDLEECVLAGPRVDFTWLQPWAT